MSKESTLARYTPGVPPADSSDMPLYMQSNLSSIASMVNSPIRNFPPLNKSPEKPRIGDLAYADGDSWDPGDGPGLYLYTEDGWILVVADTGQGGGVPVGGIIMWSGSYVPDGWALCDGSAAPNGAPTPNLINSFIKATNLSGIGNTGGSTTTGGTAITESQMPTHYHGQTGTFNTDSKGSHSHPMSTAGAHNHGTKVVTGLTVHSQGGTSSRDYPRPLENLATDGGHQHSITSAGDHTHSVSLSGITGSKGSSQSHTHPQSDPVFYALAYILRWK